MDRLLDNWSASGQGSAPKPNQGEKMRETVVRERETLLYYNWFITMHKVSSHSYIIQFIEG